MHLDIKLMIQSWKAVTNNMLVNSSILLHSNIVDILSKVSPEMMKQATDEYCDVSKMICHVKTCKTNYFMQI